MASPKRQSQRDCSKSQAARRHSTAHLCVHLRAHTCPLLHNHISEAHRGRQSTTRRVHHLRNSTRASTTRVHDTRTAVRKRKTKGRKEEEGKKERRGEKGGEAKHHHCPVNDKSRSPAILFVNTSSYVSGRMWIILSSRDVDRFL